MHTHPLSCCLSPLHFSFSLGPWEEIWSLAKSIVEFQGCKADGFECGGCLKTEVKLYEAH